MNNLEAIDAWFSWAESNGTPGDTFPSTDETAVDFWFAANGESANQHLRQFASTGDGSLLAVYSESGNSFEAGPVVFLGGEGDLHVLGDSVLEALAVVARVGADGLDSAISYGPDGPGDDAMAGWLAELGVSAVDDLKGAIAAATDRHRSVIEWITKLNDG